MPFASVDTEAMRFALCLQCTRNVVLMTGLIASCGLEVEPEEEADPSQPLVSITETGEGDSPTTGTTVAASNAIRLFAFSNSLMVHEVTPQPTEEKKVPHWLGLLATTGGVTLTVDGRYGFLRDYANFAEITPQWGFDGVAGSWTNESTPFAAVDFNRIILTPTNFIQYQSAIEPYFDDSSTSPLSTSLSTIDQTLTAHPNIPIYIYQGWADMAGYGSFPSGVDLARYHTDNQGSYHDWFLDYHDRLIRTRPAATIKMIPVGFVLAKLLSSAPLNGMTITDIYEDDAPHGQPTLYFLASLITYAALFQREPPDGFSIPSTVHSLVRDNFASINDRVWTELQNYRHTDGERTSRVF